MSQFKDKSFAEVFNDLKDKITVSFDGKEVIICNEVENYVFPAFKYSSVSKIVETDTHIGNIQEKGIYESEYNEFKQILLDLDFEVRD